VVLPEDLMPQHLQADLANHLELLLCALRLERSAKHLHKEALTHAQSRCRKLSEENDALRQRLQEALAQRGSVPAESGATAAAAAAAAAAATTSESGGASAQKLLEYARAQERKIRKLQEDVLRQKLKTRRYRSALRAIRRGERHRRAAAARTISLEAAEDTAFDVLEPIDSPQEQRKAEESESSATSASGDAVARDEATAARGEAEEEAEAERTSEAAKAEEGAGAAAARPRHGVQRQQRGPKRGLARTPQQPKPRSPPTNRQRQREPRRLSEGAATRSPVPLLSLPLAAPQSQPPPQPLPLPLPLPANARRSAEAAGGHIYASAFSLPPSAHSGESEPDRETRGAPPLPRRQRGETHSPNLQGRRRADEILNIPPPRQQPTLPAGWLFSGGAAPRAPPAPDLREIRDMLPRASRRQPPQQPPPMPPRSLDAFDAPMEDAERIFFEVGLDDEARRLALLEFRESRRQDDLFDFTVNGGM
jgi:hypothetical protein